MSRKPWFLPVVLTLLALLVRLPGIGWGLKNDLHNQSYHPDELPIWLAAQNIEPARFKFTPGFYNYWTLYLTLLRVESLAVAAYGGKSAMESADGEWTYVSRCHLAGRVLSAVAGALTVLFLFLLLRRRMNDFGSVMGALAVGVAPAHVMHSRFQTVDVLGLLLLVISLWFSLKLLPNAGDSEPEAKQGFWNQAWVVALAAGVFAGLSAATKYTGGLAILALVPVVFAARREAWPRLLGAGLAGAAVAFLLGTPGVLLDSARFWKDFSFEMRHTATAHGLVFVGMPSGFITHLGYLCVGIGTIMAILGAVGCVAAAAKKQMWIWALLAFAVPYYLVIGRAEVMFLRYSFPLYVGVAAGFGYLMSMAHERKGKYVWLAMLGLVGVGGIDRGGVQMSANVTLRMASEDPRDAAARYLKAQAQGKPEVAVGLVSDPWFQTPPLYPDSTVGNVLPVDKRDEAMRAARFPSIDLLVPDDPLSRVLGWDSAKLDRDKPQFVAISSYESVDRFRLSGMRDLPAEYRPFVDQTRNFYEELQKAYTFDRTYGGGLPAIHDFQYVSPSIEIWRLKSAKSTN